MMRSNCAWARMPLNIFVDGPREYGKYPFGIYGRPVLMVLTFLVPLALVQHWPLQYLFDRGPVRSDKSISCFHSWRKSIAGTLPFFRPAGRLG